MPKKKLASSKPPDPLDRAMERLERADEATGLLEYSADYDEPTGRHEVTVNLHGPSPSQHEIEAPATNTTVAVTVAKRLPWPVLFALGLAAIVAWVVVQLATRR